MTRKLFLLVQDARFIRADKDVNIKEECRMHTLILKIAGCEPKGLGKKDFLSYIFERKFSKDAEN